MAKLLWDQVGERIYEAGVDRAVLFVGETKGVPWNGLIAVRERPIGGEKTAYYVEGVKYLDKTGPEEFEATIEAFTYPDEFAQCDGTGFITEGLWVDQQIRVPFGLCYRTKVGNDVDGLAYGYKIHFVYNASASPSETSNVTLSENISPITFNWDLTTTPTEVAEKRPSAHLIVDSRTTADYILAAIEEFIYGTDIFDPRMPSPADLARIFAETQPPIIVDPVDPTEPQPTELTLIDNGDGTFSIVAPSNILNTPDQFTFEVDSPLVAVQDEIYTINGQTAIIVLDNGNGAYSVSGSNADVKLIDATTFEISGPTVTVSADTFSVS